MVRQFRRIPRRVPRHLHQCLLRATTVMTIRIHTLFVFSIGLVLQLGPSGLSSPRQRVALTQEISSYHEFVDVVESVVIGMAGLHSS